MRDVEFNSSSGGGSGSGGRGGGGTVAGRCGRVPEWPLVWWSGAGNGDFRPGDLGGAVDEEVLEQGGGKGHVSVWQTQEAFYGDLV
jgi:hypothetical protein